WLSEVVCESQRRRKVVAPLFLSSFRTGQATRVTEPPQIIPDFGSNGNAIAEKEIGSHASAQCKVRAEAVELVRWNLLLQSAAACKVRDNFSRGDDVRCDPTPGSVARDVEADARLRGHYQGRSVVDLLEPLVNARAADVDGSFGGGESQRDL